MHQTDEETNIPTMKNHYYTPLYMYMKEGMLHRQRVGQIFLVTMSNLCAELSLSSPFKHIYIYIYLYV